MKAEYTNRQGQFLAFIHCYTTLNGCPPAEADIGRYFHVSPSSVHAIVRALEKRGLISRVPGQARSIRVMLPPERLPGLGGLVKEPENDAQRAATDKGGGGQDTPKHGPANSDPVTTAVLDVGKAQIDAMLQRQDEHAIDDSEFIPLLEVVLDAFGTAGVPDKAVEELWQYAYAAYDRYCREHAPEFTFEENRELMRSYLVGNQDPSSQKKRRRR